MKADALQDINHILVGINDGQAAACDECLEHGNIVRALKRPAEHPVLPAHRDATQGSLQVIGVNEWINQTDPQFHLPLLDVAQGFTPRVSGNQAKTTKLLFVPGKKLINQWLGLQLAIITLFVAF